MILSSPLQHGNILRPETPSRSNFTCEIRKQSADNRYFRKDTRVV